MRLHPTKDLARENPRDRWTEERVLDLRRDFGADSAPGIRKFAPLGINPADVVP